jgi:hypothetical protein
MTDRNEKVGDGQPAAQPDAEQLREQIEQTRAELAETVEALAAKADVTGRAKEKAAEVSGNAKQAASRALHEVRDTASTVTHAAADAANTVTHAAASKASTVGRAAAEKASTVTHVAADKVAAVAHAAGGTGTAGHRPDGSGTADSDSTALAWSAPPAPDLASTPAQPSAFLRQWRTPLLVAGAAAAVAAIGSLVQRRQR